jgi:hypothetical protein
MPLALQLLLVGISILAAFLITVAGIQVFHILHEVRVFLKRLNKIATNTEVLSTSSAKPIAAVNQFFSEVKGLVKETQNDIIAATPDRVITPAMPIMPPAPPQASEESVSPRRFFHRSGSTLRGN